MEKKLQEVIADNVYEIKVSKSVTGRYEVSAMYTYDSDYGIQTSAVYVSRDFETEKVTCQSVHTSKHHVSAETLNPAKDFCKSLFKKLEASEELFEVL